MPEKCSRNIWILPQDQVESPLLSDAIFDPTDADHSFSAKVMLMAMPPPDALIEKTCQLAESSKFIFGIYFHNMKPFLKLKFGYSEKAFYLKFDATQ